MHCEVIKAVHFVLVVTNILENNSCYCLKAKLLIVIISIVCESTLNNTY